MNVQSRAHALRTKVVRGLAVGSLLALGLGAGGVSQVLGAPSLDPAASYRFDPVQLQTVINSKAYSIGPWQTIRQTYSCGLGLVAYSQNLLGFMSESSPNVSATQDGGGPGFGDVSVLFTNWNLSDAQYQVQYICFGDIFLPDSQPQTQPQPVPPTPTPAQSPVPAPQPQPVPNYYQYQYSQHSHW